MLPDDLGLAIADGAGPSDPVDPDDLLNSLLPEPPTSLAAEAALSADVAQQRVQIHEMLQQNTASAQEIMAQQKMALQALEAQNQMLLKEIQDIRQQPQDGDE